MIKVKKTIRKLKILDFDLENRPLSYLGNDYTTSEITAIAWSWTDKDEVYCFCLGEYSTEELLQAFMAFYDAADIITGHYIRKHDLPIINGALLETGMAPISSKLTSDTYTELVKRKGISASQESLAEMYDIPENKYHMSQSKWRKANRLTPEGIELSRKRVTCDVIQHKAIRERLIKEDALKPPRLWKP